VLRLPVRRACRWRVILNRLVPYKRIFVRKRE